jgi:hypothetical protein
MRWKVYIGKSTDNKPGPARVPSLPEPQDVDRTFPLQTTEFNATALSRNELKLTVSFHRVSLVPCFRIDIEVFE